MSILQMFAQRYVSPLSVLSGILVGAVSGHAQLPDLVVRSVRPEALNVSAGGRLTIDYTVRNAGAGEAEDCDAGIYLSVDRVLDAGDIFLEDDSIPDLDPFETEAENEQVTIPSGTATGQYYVLIFVDYESVIRESDETNNVGVSQAIQVTGSGIPASATVRTGCTHPAPVGSLRASSLPIIGQSFRVLVDDPTDRAGITPGSPTQFFLSFARSTSSACGIPIPGLGSRGATGELLISMGPADWFYISPLVPWAGPGRPAPHAVRVPPTSALRGVRIYGQAVLYDLGGNPVITDGIDAIVGTR